MKARKWLYFRLEFFEMYNWQNWFSDRNILYQIAFRTNIGRHSMQIRTPLFLYDDLSRSMPALQGKYVQ